MAPAGPGRTEHTYPLSESLPALAETAIAGNEDLILTVEVDPDSGTRTVHLITGKFVTSCMLRKLIGQAASQKDEGSRHIKRRLPRDDGKNKRG
jgi:hypothetical protein